MIRVGDRLKVLLDGSLQSAIVEDYDLLDGFFKLKLLGTANVRYWIGPYELLQPYIKEIEGGPTRQKCECGAASVGHFGHAFYCPAG